MMHMKSPDTCHHRHGAYGGDRFFFGKKGTKNLVSCYLTTIIWKETLHFCPFFRKKREKKKKHNGQKEKTY